MTRFRQRQCATAAAGCCALGAAVAGDHTAAAADTFAAAAAAVAAVALAAPMGIALGRLRFAGRALALAILVLATATPPALLDTAASTLGARFINKLALGVPLAAWIIFLVARHWPPHIEDAARLDGATASRLWIPLMRTTAVTTAVFVFLYGAFDLS